MTKYDNYIYMTICETTLKLFKQTSCSSHSAYCNLLRLSLNDDLSSNKYLRELNIIINVLYKMYGIDNETIGGYLVKFFEGEEYLRFEVSARLIKESISCADDVF